MDSEQVDGVSGGQGSCAPHTPQPLTLCIHATAFRVCKSARAKDASDGTPRHPCHGLSLMHP